MIYFKDMETLKRANMTRKNPWFAPEAMELFNSEIESELDHNIFISSERETKSYPKRYTVRKALADAKIIRISSFGAFKSLKKARIAMLAYIQEELENGNTRSTSSKRNDSFETKTP